MSAPNYLAQFETRNAFLFSDFGYDLAVRWFGPDAIAALPVYTNRSKHAGKPKGRITWLKCTRGGWVKPNLHGGVGHVEKRRGQILARVLSIPKWEAPDLFVDVLEKEIYSDGSFTIDPCARAIVHSMDKK